MTASSVRAPMKVGIVLFPNVEVLDFAGPFEVFSVASRVALRDGDLSVAPFEVSTVAAGRLPVVARHGLQVIPDEGISHVPHFDVLIVPGGVMDQPLADEALLAYLAKASSYAAITASVCTGAFVLAKLGLLGKRRATTHWEDIDDLKRAHPDIEVLTNVPFVDEESVVTSAGISAGILMSLHLVERLYGASLANRTARQMQFDGWPLTQS